MEIIKIEPKDLLPGVILNKNSNTFRMYGTSCPMETEEFYEPIINWMNNYLRNPLSETVFEIFFSYFDTSSSKYLLHIFYKLEDLQDAGYDVHVKWFYAEDDDDMLEEAEEFENTVYLDFEIIPVENEDIWTDNDFFNKIMEELV